MPSKHGCSEDTRKAVCARFWPERGVVGVVSTSTTLTAGSILHAPRTAELALDRTRTRGCVRMLLRKRSSYEYH